MAEASFADWRERSRPGIAMAAMMPMMATTISSSMSVKPSSEVRLIFGKPVRGSGPVVTHTMQLPYQWRPGATGRKSTEFSGIAHVLGARSGASDISRQDGLESPSGFRPTTQRKRGAARRPLFE